MTAGQPSPPLPEKLNASSVPAITGKAEAKSPGFRMIEHDADGDGVPPCGDDELSQLLRESDERVNSADEPF
jgi:hypothetical protein